MLVAVVRASEANDDHHNTNENQTRTNAENFNRSDNSTTGRNINFPSTAANFPYKGLPNTENEDPDVEADQIPETFSKESSAKISDSQTPRPKDCPLLNKTAKSNQHRMKVHVLPRAVPFNIKILVDWRAGFDDKRLYHLSSDKLSIVKDKWSEFTVKVDCSDWSWKVIASRDGEEETFQTDFHWTYIFEDLEVNILSSNVSWYVGEKNPHCDALIPMSALPTTTTTPTTTTIPTTTTTTPRNKITPSTTKTNVTIKSITDGVRASSEPLEKKGIMNE